MARGHNKRPKRKLKFKTPHTYALLMIIITIAWIMTFIIPSRV
ncbi:hypothetical protein HMPREF3225_01382 [Staphylococcus lugdunensis]|uniref:Uncharacterized protein n=1 Tax=Staphylococcus lugdunensis TaxID=28035 RepID=A0ABD4EF20_STALU|nr:hypothetical protein HMPREF3225_01382 [Staphylococcus lugdunensis]